MRGTTTARLLGLTALCLVLAAAVAITGERRGPIGRPVVAPGLTAAKVTRLELARAGAAPVVIEVGEGGAQVVAPVPGPADEAALRDVVSAIAAARADRVARDHATWQRAGLDLPRATVTVGRADGPPLEVRVGAAQGASGQVWLGVNDAAMLVPAWVGDALERDLTSLRRRRPFARTAVTGVELHGRDLDLVLAGDPLVRRDDGAGVRVAAAPRDRLLAALADLELDVLVDGPRDAAPVLTVRVLGGAAPAELAAYGPCPGHADHVLVDGSAGVGCVPAAALDEVRAAAAALAGPAGVATAPLDGVVPRSIAIAPAGAAEPLTLTRTGAAWQLARGGERWPADDDAVAALLDALARPATLVAVPTGAPTATWTVELGGGATETWDVRAGAAPTVHRRGERLALALAPAAAPPVVEASTTPLALRSRTVLVVEPTAVARVVAAGQAPAELERGATLDTWRVIDPAGATATPAIGALLDTVATLRATTWLTTTDLGRVRRTITITVDAEPVAGARSDRHTLEIGAPRPGRRCAARVDAGDVFALAATDCDSLLAPLAR